MTGTSRMGRATWRHSWLAALLLALVVACSQPTVAPPDDLRCPPPTGEFPPVACAIVVGRALDSLGRPLSNLGVSVDSLVPRVGYAYTAKGATLGVDGSFELLVKRVSQLTPLTVPDTATVEIKLHVERIPGPGTPSIAARGVLMSFAPLGQLVDRTVVDVHFPYGK